MSKRKYKKLRASESKEGEMTKKEYTFWGIGFILSVFSWIVFLFFDARTCISAALGGFVTSMVLVFLDYIGYVYRHRVSYAAGAIATSLVNVAMEIYWPTAIFYGFMMSEAVVFILILADNYCEKQKKLD